MEKLLLIALIGTGLCVMLRAIRPEYAFVSIVVTGVLLIGSVAAEATGLMDTLRKLGERFGVSEAFCAALLKMAAIAWLTSFGGNLCRDNGQSAAAGSVELGGRIALLGCAMPAVVTMLETGAAMLGGALS